MNRRLFGLLPGQTPASASNTSKGPAPRKRDYLLTIEILRDLQPNDLAEIDRQTEMLTSPKGRILYSQDDHAEALFLLKTGRVQIYRLTPSGKRLELATLEPGTFFGEMPLLGESLRHTYAEAASDCLLCVMSRADVERLIREHPSVALRMMEVLGRRLALAEARLEEMAYRGVAARIAAVLLRMSNGQSGSVLAITHQELGDMIGALRETVTKTLDEFQADSLVDLGRGRITVRDVPGLRAYLED